MVDPEKSPVDMQKHLAGIDFPASKQEIIAHAESRDASEDLLAVLQRLPSRQFNGPTEVSQAVSAIQ